MLAKAGEKQQKKISANPSITSSFISRNKKKISTHLLVTLYFQKTNKTFIFHPDFIKEAEDRKLHLNNPSKTSEFLKPLNTFEGLTLSFSCNKLHSSNNGESFSSEKLSHFLFTPIFTFDFTETMILEDSLSIFWQFLVNSHLTHHEKAHEKVFFYYNFFLIFFAKEKMKKILKLIFMTVLQIPLKSIEKTKENLDETVYFLEQRLLDKEFLPSEATSEHICQDIIENIQNNLFLNILEETPPIFNINQEHPNKFQLNCSKKIQFLEEDVGKLGLFWPETFENDHLLYGTRNLYVFLRFFYTFYEQMLMAFQLSKKLEKSPGVENLQAEVIFLLIN